MTVDRIKLVIQIVARSATAMVGGLIFLQRLRVDAGFSVNDCTAMINFMIGGIGTFEGPIPGALIYVFLDETLSTFRPVYLIILGAAAIAVMLIETRASGGFVRSRWSVQLLPLGFRVEKSGPAN
ncbi:hypothetical protein [Bradyrhizobium mercantei]|uniref:hypothetical protein n=1 Tax=Bradyrhizobium mercantei TaxID=1904807 RepID=UPI000976A37A|nr:hypothetical protein [Bradyrhizobium mercantei]